MSPNPPQKKSVADSSRSYRNSTVNMSHDIALTTSDCGFCPNLTLVSNRASTKRAVSTGATAPLINIFVVSWRRSTCTKTRDRLFAFRRQRGIPGHAHTSLLIASPIAPLHPRLPRELRQAIIYLPFIAHTRHGSVSFFLECRNCFPLRRPLAFDTMCYSTELTVLPFDAPLFDE
ncbi:hypothetical protein BDZ97DRAFT_1152303 [Flammula alnicola]|nr:hypothetical protein BDZ97DRAFT_1152303 [Flammula alnicola]